MVSSLGCHHEAAGREESEGGEEGERSSTRDRCWEDGDCECVDSRGVLRRPTRRRRVLGGSSAALMICVGLTAMAREAGGTTACYASIEDRQGSSLSFSASAALSRFPLKVCGDGINVCSGSTVVGNMTGGSALHAPVYPSTSSANCGLFCQEVTAEAVVKIDDERVYNSTSQPVTLMGNMVHGSGLQGVASGWRIACFQSKCCFQAHIGNKWVIGSSYSPQQRALAPMREVCTREGSLVMGTWYHIAATYSSSTGKAKVYLDGFLHGEAVFAASGDLATGTLSTQEINYDYSFSSSPWWSTSSTPDARCPAGSSSGCTRLAPFRIGAQLGTDHNGNGFPGAEVSFFNGVMDEVRVWRSVRTDKEVQDASFEVAVRNIAASCALSRLAGTTSSDALAKLVVYLHHPNMGVAMGAATSVNNEVSIASGPPNLVTLNSSSVNVSVLGTEYIDRPVMTVLQSSTSRGVLADLAASAGRPHTVIVGQKELVIVDMVVYDPNYDDVVWIDQTSPLAWNYSVGLAIDDVCYLNNGQPFSIACNDGDPVGWAAFSGFQADNYQGPGGLSSRYKHIVLDQSIWCVDTPNAPAIEGLLEYVPPYTTTKASVTYRIVWQPRYDLEWWVPEGGWGFIVGFKNTVKGVPLGSPGGTDTPLSGQLGFVIDVDVSPEFLDPITYPRYLSKDAALLSQQSSRLLEDTLDSPAPNAVYVTRVGEPMTFSVRIRDRNVEDVVEIKVRGVYGMPAGASEGRVVLNATERTQSSSRGGICFTNVSSPHLNPPMNYERRFRWTPNVDDLNVMHKVCFYAESSSANSTRPHSPDASARSSSEDRCVILKVVAPQPTFVAPGDGEEFRPAGHTFIARVGCVTEIKVRVKDMSVENAGGYSSSDPYTMFLSAEEEGSRMCSAGGCQALVGGLPVGATLTAVSITGNVSDYVFRWIPTRGQEMHESYRVCMTASDANVYARETLCYLIKVRKCQYCLQPGQTMRSVAQDFDLDFLELYLANPSLTRPDHLPPYTVLTTGALYDVREGDYLELLEEKFLVSRNALLSANPDIRSEVQSLSTCNSSSFAPLSTCNSSSIAPACAHLPQPPFCFSPPPFPFLSVFSFSSFSASHYPISRSHILTLCHLHTSAG